MVVLIAGDFCPQARVIERFEENDFSSVLDEVKEVTAKVDYSIVNFECPVTKGIEEPIKKQGPNLHCTEKGIEAVKWAGFDCVTLANNHFLDFGDKGVKNTLDVCKKNNLDTVGGGLNLAEASKILYKESQGARLAVINCCEHEFSIATTKTAGSNPLNPIQQYYAIKEAKTKADYVLVIVHGGHEHYQLPSPRMQETYRFFIDAGADAVVNHHQHCYSGYEVYHEKPIFYGIGNFCFDGNRSKRDIWYEGYMVEIEFGKNIKYEITPYRQCCEEAKVSILKDCKYEEKISELNQIIVTPERLEEETQKYYKSCAEDYSKIIEPCNNRYYLACKRRGWLPSFITERRKLSAANFILCESHRDKLIYWLKSLF